MLKQVNQYQEEIYENKFRLADDGDRADVIFLYRDDNDVFRSTAHYVKSATYNGYVQCLERDCPICKTGKMRVQTKLFIPLYNLTTQRFEFWDRNYPFKDQLIRDVFKHYPNPVNYVFTITRKGEARSKDTRYTIELAGKNSSITYEQILEKFKLKMPDAYEMICKDFNRAELEDLVSSSNNTVSDNDLPDYAVTPRALASTITTPTYEPVPEDATFDSDDGDVDDVNW